MWIPHNAPQIFVIHVQEKKPATCINPLFICEDIAGIMEL